MEYVKGISVAELRHTRGRLHHRIHPRGRSPQLAEALAVAHEQRIIHRDIKPTERGRHFDPGLLDAFFSQRVTVKAIQQASRDPVAKP